MGQPSTQSLLSGEIQGEDMLSQVLKNATRNDHARPRVSLTVIFCATIWELVVVGVFVKSRNRRQSAVT